MGYLSSYKLSPKCDILTTSSACEAISEHILIERVRDVEN